MASKEPQDAKGYKGWVAPDGTFHSNEGNLYPSNTHYATLERLGLAGRDYMDYSKAYDKGYAHLADDMDYGGETGSKIHLHHPKIQYTEMQLATLKRLAKREGVGASVTTRINGKPGTRELKLSATPGEYRLHHVNKKTGEKIPFKDSPTLKLPKEKLEALAQKINGNQERPYPPDWEAQVLKLADPGQSSVIVRVPLPQPVETKPQTPSIKKTYVW